LQEAAGSGLDPELRLLKLLLYFVPQQERPSSGEDLHDISKVLIRGIQSDTLDWDYTASPTYMQSASSQLRPANRFSEVDNNTFF